MLPLPTLLAWRDRQTGEDYEWASLLIDAVVMLKARVDDLEAELKTRSTAPVAPKEPSCPHASS